MTTINHITDRERELSERLAIAEKERDALEEERNTYARSAFKKDERIAELERAADIYAAEREHAKTCYVRSARILTGIHALLYPPRFTDHDGRTWQFKSPLAEEQMQELSDRIRALPDEIAAIDALGQQQTICGMRVVVDPTMPADLLSVMHDGAEVGRVKLYRAASETLGQPEGEKGGA